MKREDYEYLLKLLKENAGWEFDDEKYFVLDKKIYQLVRERGYSSTEVLIEELKRSPKTMLWQVVETLAMSDTSFFRDYNVFKGFEDYVLPNVREDNRSIKKIRIWSLGCSTGQETYSIAMMVKNKLKDLSDWQIDIIGTDISTASIVKAQKGSYSQFEVQVGMNAKTLIDNFDLLPDVIKDESRFERDIWQVKPEIMNTVEFRRYNILDDLVFAEKFDVIFCRNMLRFFDKENQRRIIRKIYERQVSGGFLYLGVGEIVEDLDLFYEPVQGLKCLYKSKEGVVAPVLEPLLQTKREIISAEQPKPSVSEPAPKGEFAEAKSPTEEMPTFRRPIW